MVLGLHSLLTPDGTAVTREIRSIIVHPDYQDDFGRNDIAVLK